jgi:phage terminase small subunit
MTANARTPLSHRHLCFVLAFIANGGKGGEAAIEAGYSAQGISPSVTANRLLKNANVRAEIARRSHRIAVRAEITVERTLRENAAIAFFDPRRLYADDGTMLPIKEWPDDVAAAVASVKTHEHYDGEDKARVVKWEVRFWNKCDALEKLFKFERLYEEAPPDDRGTTSILNLNFDALTADERRQLRWLLNRALPQTLVEG